MNLPGLLKRKIITRSLGVHDVFSAMVAEQAGIEMLFVGGFGVSASFLGKPDVGLISLTEMAGVVGRISQAVKIPVVADGDTGFGGLPNIVRTVELFEAAGAAGVILEDQVSPKRCGHFKGKRVIPAGEMVLKLKAALNARRNKNFLIFARTDARDTNGIGEALRRAKLYRSAGADVSFIESPGSLAELKVIPRAVSGPVLINMLTGGTTPNHPVSDLEKMGYKIVVYPIESLLMTVPIIRRLTKSIMIDGSMDKIKREMISFSEVKTVLGLNKFVRSKGGEYGYR